MRVVESFCPSDVFSCVKIVAKPAGEIIELEDLMCHFSDFLDGDRSVDENDRIAQAFLKLNSLLKQPPKLTLDYLVSTLEKTSFLEIILKILLPLAMKLEVEKKYICRMPGSPLSAKWVGCSGWFHSTCMCSCPSESS